MTQGTGEDADVSLSGNLEDVPLADVLQFIHLGRRTGTLLLTRNGNGAEIGFHHGQIISASSPGSQRLGDRLVRAGLIDDGALSRGLESQQGQTPRQSLGSILVSQGAIDGEALRREIETQIAETVYELVTWTQGVFKFTLDELRPVDDIGMFPGDLIPHIDLNTQMVLLEAARIHDERRRHDGPAALDPAPVRPPIPPPPPPRGGSVADGHAAAPEDPVAASSTEIPDGDTLASLIETLGEPTAARAPAEEIQKKESRIPYPVRIQVLTSDETFFADVARHFEGTEARTVRIRPHEAGIGLHGEAPPIVIFDLRNSAIGPQDIRALRRSRPRAPIIAVVEDDATIGRVIESGALAALPAEQRAVVSCVESVLSNRFDRADDPAIGAGRAGLARLRRILGDLRSGLLSATVALNLLHIFSESVERAILFLVKEEWLASIGAFGFGNQGELLAQATRGFRLPRTGSHPLISSVENRQVLSVSFGEAGFPSQLVELLGPPETGQVVVFPVLGAERVIAVIYADNGRTTRVIDDIELLELATAQVGMAFENELLRRQALKRAGSP